MKHSRKGRLLAVIAAVGLIASACGGDDDDASSEVDAPADSSANTESESDDSAPSTDEVPDSAPATDADADEASTNPDGVLRYARGADATMDPHRSTVAPDNEVLFIVYDRLVHQTAAGELVGGLAESWSVSDDGLSLVLSVRPDVTFHDGEPVDAEAVKINLDRARTDERSAVKSELANIEDVEVTGDLEVTLRLTQPQANLAALLSDRAGALISPAAIERDDVDVNPVGAGMYAVETYNPGVGGRFVRYPEYWEPEAQGLAAIDYQIIADRAAVFSALRTDQIDYAVIDAASVETAESDGLQIVSGPSSEVYYLNLNMARPGLDDVNVRRAIAHAIDREGMLQALFFGEGEITSQLFPDGDAGYNADIAPDAYAYDPELAASLLAESGYEPGELEYTLIAWDSATDPINEMDQVIQENLGAIGITVNIELVDVTSVADIHFVNKDSDTMQGKWSGRPSPEQTIQLLRSSTGFANPGGWAPDGFDELLAQASGATTEDDRTAALQELAQIGFDEALHVPLVHPYVPKAAQPRVQGLESYVSGKLEFRGVSIADE